MKKANVLLTVCGTTLGVASAAMAGAPFQFNISGATLLENTVISPGSTNDWLDVDGDNVAGSLGSFVPDQLARFYNPDSPPAGFPAAGGGEGAFQNYHWVAVYRVVGSVNGIQSLVDFGSPFFCLGPDCGQPGASGDLCSTQMTDGYWNRSLFYSSGPVAPLFDSDNCSGLPTRQAFADYGAVRNATDATAGVQICIAPTDVPTAWGVIDDVAKTPSEDAAQPFATPQTFGYGDNPRLPTDAMGNPVAGDDNKLAALGPRNLFDPANPGAADANTIFDNSLAWAPIANTCNVGLGIQEMTISQLQHTLTTGRLPSGENTVQCTRDSGSGTRNGHNNTTGIDPSWGRGENIGERASSSSTDLLGPNFQPSNKGGSSRMDGAVKNHRLAHGYTGAERTVFNQQLLIDKENEVLAIKDDLLAPGGTFNRPSIDNILDNTAEGGYRIGGPATLSTLGDPRSGLISAVGNDGGNTNPAMANVNAAEYLNNITRSIENVVSIPNDPDNELQPGEVIARLLIPPQALDNFLSNILLPRSWDVNPDLNQNLQNEVRSISVLGSSALDNFDTSHAGLVPQRTSGLTYTDGNVGDNYVAQDGDTFSYGGLLTMRNRICGDFNGDGERDWNDSLEMMRAANDRAGNSAWAAPDGIYGAGAGDDAIIEVLGDFTGDGNFDADDVRYWADGLAVQPGGAPGTRPLDRVEGFTRVDADWAAVGGTKNPGGYFNTALANPSATYDNGDARADVAGTGLGTPGWNPTGADGVVDGADIDYVYANFGDWSNLVEAIEMDLSCDMDGDLDVDIDDVCTILTILETTYGDVNLDGTVDATDTGIATANIGIGSTWAEGDVDGDGDVDQDDVDAIQKQVDGDTTGCPPVPAPGGCVGDINSDGTTDVFDFADLASNFGAGPGATFAQGDITGDGFVDVFDFADLAADFGCDDNN